MLTRLFGGGGSGSRPSSTAATPAPFSIAHLEALHLTLTKQRAFSAAAFSASDKAAGASGSSAVAKGATFGYDAAVVVDTLKQISELMVYGDKNNAERFFEVFCERNMLRTFVDLFQEGGGGALSNPRHDEVRVQVLQTVSILLMNIANQRSLFYLLSNNFVNELISSPFDMNHEELLGYYISLLKTLSLSFNRDTIQFFYYRSVQKKNASEQIATESFPLYTQAVRLYSNEESMVRTAVRAITLNVFNTADSSLRKFLTKGEHSSYPEQLALHLRISIIKLSNAVSEWHLTTVSGTRTTSASSKSPAVYSKENDTNTNNNSRRAGQHQANYSNSHTVWTPKVFEFLDLIPVTQELIDADKGKQQPSNTTTTTTLDGYRDKENPFSSTSSTNASTSTNRAGGEGGAPKARKSLDHARAEIGTLLSNVLDECFYLQDVLTVGQSEIEAKHQQTVAKKNVDLSSSSSSTAETIASSPVRLDAQSSSFATPSKSKSPRPSPETDDGGSILPITDAVCDYLISHVLVAVILPSWRRNGGGGGGGGGGGEVPSSASKSPSFALIDPGVAMLVLANMLQIFRYKRLSKWLERALFHDHHSAALNMNGEVKASVSSSTWTPSTLREAAMGLVLSRDQRLSGCALLALRSMLKMPLVSPSSLAAVGLLPRARWAKLTASAASTFSSSTIQNHDASSGGGGGGPSSGNFALSRPPLVPHLSMSTIQQQQQVGTPSASNITSSSSSSSQHNGAVQMSPSRNRASTLNFISASSTPAPKGINGGGGGIKEVGGYASGRGKSSSAASEPDVTADVQIGIRSLRKAHPNIHHTQNNSSLSQEGSNTDEESLLFHLPDEDVTLQQSRTEETVSVLLVVLSSDPPPRPANLALALTLLLELVYIPPQLPSSSPLLLQHAPIFSPNQIVLLRKACAALGKAVSHPVMTAYNDADGNLLLRLLAVAESAAEDEARNSLVQSLCARVTVDNAQATPRCDIPQEEGKQQLSQNAFHAKHGSQCKSSAVLSAMSARGSTISSSSLSSPETVDFLLPTAPCPKAAFWFELGTIDVLGTEGGKGGNEEANGNDGSNRHHPVVQTNNDGGGGSGRAIVAVDALAAACRPPYRTPTHAMNVSLLSVTPGFKMDPRSMQPLVLDFVVSLQQLLVLRALLLGVEGESLSRLVRSAYSSSRSNSNNSSSEPIPTASSSSSSGASLVLGELEQEDLACGVWCLDPIIREIAPPLDGIAAGNTFSLTNLPWFQATHFPVFLPPGVSSTNATVIMQGAIESRRRLGVVLGQSFFVLTEVAMSSSSNNSQQQQTSKTSPTNGTSGEQHPALGSSGNSNSAGNSVNGASQSPVKVKGKALLVIPLHLVSLHLVSSPESSPAILDVRFISGSNLTGLAVEATDSPAHSSSDSLWSAAATTSSSSPLPRPRRYGFALALESPEVAARAIEHVTVASSRAVTMKVAAFEKLSSGTHLLSSRIGSSGNGETGEGGGETAPLPPQKRQVELVTG